MNQLKLRILEYKEGTYEGNAYASILARHNGRVLKFKLDRSKTGNLEKLVDRDVDARYEIVSGQNMSATIHIVEVIE